MLALAALVSAAASVVVLILLIEIKWPWVWLDIKHFQKFGASLIAYKKCIKNRTFLVDLFEGHAKVHPKKKFLIFKDKPYTYEYADKEMNRVGNAVKKMGLKCGDNVAMLMFNGPEFLWTYLGLSKLGVQPAFLNFNLRSRSLLHCIMVSDPKILIVGQGEELLNAITHILPDLKEKLPSMKIYVQGSSFNNNADLESFDDILAAASTEPIDRSLRKSVGLNDPACFIFTSGTTGLPKAAVVTHAKVIKGSLLMRMVGVGKDDTVYTPLPLYHSAAGIVALGNTVLQGSTLVLREKFSVSKYWEDCRKHNVTVIQYIGELCRYLLTKPKGDDDYNHKVRVAFGNGLRADIWKEFTTRFNVPIVGEFYAATEGNAGFLNIYNKFGSVGRQSPIIDKVYPVTMVKYDLNKEEPERDANGFCRKVRPGETGLMVSAIKRDFEFDGYKGNKELSEKKILRNVFKKGDVYFNSGDLLSMDDLYYVYFKDRIGDTFRWKGENVSTTEVANVVSDLSFIQDANVYGVQIPGQDGRAGMCAITLISGDDVMDEKQLSQIYEHCDDLLPSYARPKFLRLQKELIITSTFKNKKVELVADGFDIQKVKEDKLFLVDPKNKTYVPLTPERHEDVVQGKIKL